MAADLEQLWRQVRPRSKQEAHQVYSTNLRRQEQAHLGEPIEPRWAPAAEEIPVLPGPRRVVEERVALDGRHLQRMSDGTIRERPRP